MGLKPLVPGLWITVLVAATVAAQPEFADAPPPPPLSESEANAPDTAAELEPEVTIRKYERGTVQEYRVNGRLYMVKVIPKVGPPYYLVDRDGNGLLETRLSDLGADFRIPMWVLFSW